MGLASEGCSGGKPEMPFDPPVTEVHSTKTMRMISPSRNVTSTKYLPVRRNTTGPMTNASKAGPAMPMTSPSTGGRPNLVTDSTQQQAPTPMKAAWPSEMCPVRMIRCRLVAPIAFSTIKVAIVNRNGFGANSGHPTRNTRSRAAPGQRTFRDTANDWRSSTTVAFDTLIVSLRDAEQSPGAQDQQRDHSPERDKGGNCGAVECREKTLAEAKDDSAKRSTGDASHTPQDHNDEGHHQ